MYTDYDRIRRNPEIIHASMGNELVLMSMENGEYYGINEVGAKIWELLDNEMEICRLVENLEHIYEVESATCNRDLRSFLEPMIKKSIFLVSPAS